MSNPIMRSSLFATPDSYEALDAYIRALPYDQRSVAYMISMMTMNLCNKLVDEQTRETA
jgi:hypothetical protein